MKSVRVAQHFDMSMSVLTEWTRLFPFSLKCKVKLNEKLKWKITKVFFPAASKVSLCFGAGIECEDISGCQSLLSISFVTFFRCKILQKVDSATTFDRSVFLGARKSQLDRLWNTYSVWIRLCFLSLPNSQTEKKSTVNVYQFFHPSPKRKSKKNKKTQRKIKQNWETTAGLLLKSFESESLLLWWAIEWQTMWHVVGCLPGINHGWATNWI